MTGPQPLHSSAAAPAAKIVPNGLTPIYYIGATDELIADRLITGYWLITNTSWPTSCLITSVEQFNEVVESRGRSNECRSNKEFRAIVAGSSSLNRFQTVPRTKTDLSILVQNLDTLRHS